VGAGSLLTAHLLSFDNYLSIAPCILLPQPRQGAGRGAPAPRALTPLLPSTPDPPLLPPLLPLLPPSQPTSSLQLPPPFNLTPIPATPMCLLPLRPTQISQRLYWDKRKLSSPPNPCPSHRGATSSLLAFPLPPSPANRSLHSVTRSLVATLTPFCCLAALTAPVLGRYASAPIPASPTVRSPPSWPPSLPFPNLTLTNPPQFSECL
jgi:hypothetical protein